MMAGNGTETAGWVDAPNVRGSIDILWSCALVLSTALYTVLHLNIPGPNDSLMVTIMRKIRWGMLAILAPDLLVYFSAMQWEAAQQAVEQMHRMGHKHWTLKHAFYANSGGFVLRSIDYRPFPITSAALQYLVEADYIECPTITEEEIWDKSKADVFAKCVALVQTAWLAVQAIARVIQGLSVTPLELFSLGFVLSTMMSYYFWMHKPQNVSVPTYIDLKYGSVNAILNQGGNASVEDFQHTPLDFVEKPMQRWHRRPTLEKFGLEEGPLQRMPDDKIPVINMRRQTWILVTVQAMVHPAIHCLGWNHLFPTPTERLLWRIGALVLASGLPLATTVRVALTALGFKGHRSLTYIWIQPTERPPGWRPWVLDIISTLISMCLVPARLYIIVEAFISLRRLPVSSFQTVAWTGFIPHV
ncbi:hypothetical protein BO86DRAFT_205658 [Aspergillus japonicus CBS 114.51]|uniref:Uncharacterized protein n=3 Tax=Aspergillus TaxID=5052 RepID=A0A2V5I955_ASPV1|nr:hypothetical protein BO86DRAFT_205658 [Aspergillus japonicus CBS 114.51]PYI16136.1 hypothetical protein BO99DRAFT_232848 [Aspergillus violaceofuscus CBS 115571]PYI33553.1 hypothetical protein BP00DRAFT_118077 [Aspergillus indologenus CBS 114.80]RAH77755.1 hypothetical protein BO86DRAFT_205658 [Aspergillus japonicus CBS 114.51]